MLKILFLLPNQTRINNSEFFYLGSTKDISSRLNFFKEQNCAIFFLSPIRSLFSLVKNSRNFKKKDFDHVIVEHSPSILVQIFIFFKFGKVIYRSHNAEAYHRFDMFQSYFDLYRHKIPFKRIRRFKFLNYYTVHMILIKLFFGIFRFLIRDLFTAVVSKKIIANCEWERDNYWSKFLSKKKCYYATPYLSKDYLDQINLYKTVMLNKKRDIVIIPGSSHPSQIAYHQTLCFINFLAEAIKEKSEIINKYKFVLTGRQSYEQLMFLKEKIDLSKSNIYIYLDKDILGYREYFSYIDYLKINIPDLKILNKKHYHSFYRLLACSKFSLILSNKGYGFKNKSLEILMLKSKLIVPEKLYNRLPRQLKKVVISTEENNFNQIEKQLLNDNNTSTNEENNINKIVEKDSYKQYKAAFNL